MREPGSGTRMAVERFFDELGVAIKVEMEIGSNYVVYPASKQLSVVANTFLEYLLDEGKRIATQVDLEITQRP